MRKSPSRTAARYLCAVAALGVAFAAGWGGRSLTAERAATVYARYVTGQPSRKTKLPEDGVLPLVAANDYHQAVRGLRTPDDIEARRAALRAFIWRGGVYPDRQMPDSVQRETIEPLLLDLGNLARVDRLVIRQAYGIDSLVLHLKAEPSASCLMVYQEGHRVSFLARKRFFDKVLSAGCDVLALSLPATGPYNPRPTIRHPRLGILAIRDPDALEILETERFGTIQLFTTPVLVALNHALAERSYGRVGMAGFSGGGWLTEIVAALDARIGASYAVAGSAPLAAHASILEWGSYEQRMGRLYEIANYAELYAMGAAGPGRRQMQAFNKHDPCCFAGENWRGYADAVRDKAAEFGGQFRIVVDDSNTRHTLSAPIEDLIIEDFVGGREGPPVQRVEYREPE